MLDTTGDTATLSLAGRTTELQLVAQSWQAVLDSTVPNTTLLFFFSGWRGMGKSRLLAAIAALPKPTHLMQVKLSSSARGGDVWVELEQFFNTLHQQINQYKPLETYNRLRQNRVLRLDHDGMTLRANSLTTDLVRLHQEKGFATLLLHDDVSNKAFQWLSKYFYKKLFDHRALSVVATGANTPTISSISLLPYFHTNQLATLNAAECRQLLQPFGFAPQVEADLIEFSGGIPGCLSEGVQRVTQKYEGSLAKAMATYLLEGLSPTLAQYCLYLAPLRWFNHDLMSLLPEVMADAPLGHADFLRLGRELNDKVDFIETGQNYYMQPAARHVLTHALSYTPGKPLPQIHLKAASYYHDIITRLKPEQRPVAALEYIYHQVQYQLTQNTNPKIDLKAFNHIFSTLGETGLIAHLHSLLGQDPDLGQLKLNRTD